MSPSEGWQVQDLGSAEVLAQVQRQGKTTVPAQGCRQEAFPLTKRHSPFVLLRPSADCTRPTHLVEGHLLTQSADSDVSLIPKPHGHAHKSGVQILGTLWPSKSTQNVSIRIMEGPAAPPAPGPEWSCTCWGVSRATPAEAAWGKQEVAVPRH